MPNQRVVLLGIDSVSLDWLLTWVGRGVMPTVRRLIERGALCPMRSFSPVDTGTNWASIATGAPPMVHGCNMSMHLAGEPLDRHVTSFPSDRLQAEPLWLAAQRSGRTAVVFDWPHSFPFQSAERLLHVGEDGRPDNAIRALQEVRGYTTSSSNRDNLVAQRGRRAHVLPVSFGPPEGWSHLPVGGQPSLAAELPVVPGEQSRYRHVGSLWALLWPGLDGYERLSLHTERDAEQPLATLRLGERSGWLRHQFETDRGPVSAAFQAKLLRLSADGRDVHLYLGEIYPLGEFAYPPSLAEELLEVAGPFTAQPSRQQVVFGGASDVATYVEEQVLQGAWYERALQHVLSRAEWDLCMLKWHSTDWTNHLLGFAMEHRHPLYDPAREPEALAAWERLFIQADRLIGVAWGAVGEDAIMAVVSDHGSRAVPPTLTSYPDLNALLEQGGWLVRSNGWIDWSRTRAYAYSHYVWLNVRGRDPDGIVAPGEEYRRERDRLIGFLLGARSSELGGRTLRTVWPIEEAAVLGVGGERVGDVFVQPWTSEEELDRRYAQARAQAGDGRFGSWDWPAVNSGEHTPDPFFLLAGPGVRPGYRRPLAAPLSAVAPTLSHLSGIPVPRQATGPVLWDVLTDA